MTKGKRASLDGFASPAVAAQPDAGTVQHSAAPAPVSAPEAAKHYPKINVYLTADEVRSLKLIGVDTGQRVSEIGAIAIREWLERNGHARKFSA